MRIHTPGVEMLGVRASLVGGDVEILPNNLDSFDGVCSFRVLHHTLDVDSAIREIHRVFRFDGTLILSVCYKYSLVIAWRVIVDGDLRRRLFKRGLTSFHVLYRVSGELCVGHAAGAFIFAH